MTARTTVPNYLRDCITADDVSAFLRPVFRAMARDGLRVTSGWDHGTYSSYFFMPAYGAVPVVTWFAVPSLDEPSADAPVSCMADVEIVSHRRLLIGGRALPDCTQEDLLRDLAAVIRGIASELDDEKTRIPEAPLHRGGPLAPVTFAFGLHPPSGATVH